MEAVNKQRHSQTQRTNIGVITFWRARDSDRRDIPTLEPEGEAQTLIESSPGSRCCNVRYASLHFHTLSSYLLGCDCHLLLCFFSLLSSSLRYSEHSFLEANLKMFKKSSLFTDQDITLTISLRAYLLCSRYFLFP